MLSSPLATPLPAVIRLADRCWCDVSSSRLFESFDIARWERLSVEQLKEELERDAARLQQLSSSTDESDIAEDADSSADPTTISADPKANLTLPTVELSSTVENPAEPQLFNGPPVVRSENLPLLRRKYDLRPYGFSMVLDFGWSRE